MSHLAACFNDDDLMETNGSGSNFDYLPAVVTKSNSLTSNECHTSRSSFDTDVPLSSRPSTSLKLVLKRQPNNTNFYEIKTNLHINGQQSNDSWGKESLSSTTQNACNVLPNGKRIPRRQSARKVKFIFSDQDSDEDEKNSRRKKRIKQSNDLTPLGLTSKSKPMVEKHLPQIQQTVASKYQNLEAEDSENEYFEELFRKNMPQARTVVPNLIPNTIQLAQQHFLQNQMLLNTLNNVQNISNFNACSTQSKKSQYLFKKTLATKQPLEILAVRPKKKVTKKNKKLIAQRTRCVPQTTLLESKTKSDPSDHSSSVKFRATSDNSFSKEELIKSTLLEKHQILNKQPVVIMEHSKPFPIALVESETNIVETKAVLFMHLFQSLSSPCIGCPECSDFMTCGEFSKHIHIDDDDDEGLPELKKPKALKSYKILPYRMNEDEELSENDMNIWRKFGKRCAQFKHDKQKAQAESKQTIMVPKDINNNNVVSMCKTNPTESPITSVNNMFKFEEWDSKENDNFLISRERFDCDQVCTVKYHKACKENVHYFMEEKEDLMLSEDESESRDTSSISENNFHLNSSETSNKAELDNSPIKQLLDNMVDQVVQCSRNNHLLSEMEIIKNRLRTESTSCSEIDSNNTDRKPTILERYFNFYDNLTSDVLLYICDNSLTIIPDSYVHYINNKREINLKELKLSNTNYHQGKWLEQILDLECNSLLK